MRIFQLFVLVLAVMVVVASVTMAQSTGPAPLPLVPEGMIGADLFRLYCATCHGRDGAGHGPIASALKTEPSDLTVLSIHNAGVFPRARVASLITGDIVVTAHGSEDMPVWGPIFRGLDDSEARVKVRIANLVSYIESIQRK